ncbi:type II toxin-antitoxin system VapC family toxin [Spirosoma validum]|uniref:Type II toxin-antitoxin system VapC family toxin n=1 Tax=Spirosoma validum TaxID=2771355 RepID=A0A927B2A9_9BACT|nr:type II toxin-antitoxin system VapC family toxin [Spirosoma validum]MBD2754281.1 type II toxin-antitoxin system VapC family toxin [Spirosoma validum]
MEQIYLADTQIVIWSIISPSKITPSVQTILRDNPILVSEVSLLEITIKQKIGRLPEFSLSVENLTTQLINDGFQLLPIERKYIAAYEQIPLFDNHRDPFDRLLLATAFSENIPIISADKNFRLYVPTIRLVEV